VQDVGQTKKAFDSSNDIRSYVTCMKSDSKQHYDAFKFFPLYGVYTVNLPIDVAKSNVTPHFTQ
jgi:hypothetical protein